MRISLGKVINDKLSKSVIIVAQLQYGSSIQSSCKKDLVFHWSVRLWAIFQWAPRNRPIITWTARSRPIIHFLASRRSIVNWVAWVRSIFHAAARRLFLDRCYAACRLRRVDGLSPFCSEEVLSLCGRHRHGSWSTIFSFKRSVRWFYGIGQSVVHSIWVLTECTEDRNFLVCWIHFCEMWFEFDLCWWETWIWGELDGTCSGCSVMETELSCD